MIIMDDRFGKRYLTLKNVKWIDKSFVELKEPYGICVGCKGRRVTMFCFSSVRKRDVYYKNIATKLVEKHKLNPKYISYYYYIM